MYRCRKSKIKSKFSFSSYFLLYQLDVSFLRTFYVLSSFWFCIEMFFLFFLKHLSWLNVTHRVIYMMTVGVQLTHYAGTGIRTQKSVKDTGFKVYSIFVVLKMHKTPSQRVSRSAIPALLYLLFKTYLILLGDFVIIKGLCVYCNKPGIMHTCKLCGANVCDEHYDISTGLCYKCASKVK